MSRTRYKIFGSESEYPVFLTCTVVGWIAVFTRQSATQIVFDSWKHLQSRGEFRLFGYVILENHIHFIAQSPELIAAVQSFKSWTARKLLDLLERDNASVLLEQFRMLKLAQKRSPCDSFGRKVLCRSKSRMTK